MRAADEDPGLTPLSAHLFKAHSVFKGCCPTQLLVLPAVCVHLYWLLAALAGHQLVLVVVCEPMGR